MNPQDGFDDGGIGRVQVLAPTSLEEPMDEKEIVDRVIRELRRRALRYIIWAVAIALVISYFLGKWDLPSWLTQVGPGPDAGP
jgi:hypothetical protein